MEVIYQPPIMDRIRKAVYDADASNRSIEKIVLDALEWEELMAWNDRTLLFTTRLPSPRVTGRAQVFGVWVERCPA